MSQQSMEYRDKPAAGNTACRMKPIHTPCDAAADALREQILTMPDSPVTAGRVWYLSNGGSDDAAGDSPETAWATVAALEAHDADIREGDAVLFERGGVFRGHILAKSGVTYAAYGTGDKPCIYASRRNYATAEWENRGGGLWVTVIPDPQDAGIMVFDHGEGVGIKKKTVDDLRQDGDFCCEGERVWLRIERAPGDTYGSIEIGELFHVFLLVGGTHHVTIENLTIKYGGGMAIQGVTDVSDVTVRGCEIGWMGGSYLPNYGDGTARFGNGIEFWRGCHRALIEYCWIYQIYDTGFSHQGRGEFVVEDLTFRHNLVEYTSFASIEFWAPTRATNAMRRIRYTDNILRFAGYGWGDIERPDFHALHLTTTGSDNVCEDFLISGNVFDTAAGSLVACCFTAGEKPVLDSNTYVQNRGGGLGFFVTDRGASGMTFDADAAQNIRELFGDRNAAVTYTGTAPTDPIIVKGE